MTLTGRVALVTGASRGIGRGIALALAAAGAKVGVNYTTAGEAAAQVVGEIVAGGGEALAVPGDVAAAGEVDRLVKQVLERFGRIDILVNNAGITRDNLLLRMKDEEWDRVLEVDLRGAFYCTRAVARQLLKQRWGRIINISSVVGLTGNAGQANYAAAKAGMIGFTRSVARELASRGITANVVCPGYVETDMTGALPPAAKTALLEQIPLGRAGTAGDVAQVVVFLAGPGAEYITGQTICVDGGMTMQ